MTLALREGQLLVINSSHLSNSREPEEPQGGEMSCQRPPKPSVWCVHEQMCSCVFMWCVCMHVSGCVCMHVFVYSCVCGCVYMQVLEVCAYVLFYVHVCGCVCMYVFGCMYIWFYIHACMCGCVYMGVGVVVCAWLCGCVCMHMYMVVCTYMHVVVCAHMCGCICMSVSWLCMHACVW